MIHIKATRETKKQQIYYKQDSKRKPLVASFLTSNVFLLAFLSSDLNSLFLNWEQVVVLWGSSGRWRKKF